MSGFTLSVCSISRLEEYVDVFRGSSIWDRYFSDGNRLQRSLRKAVEREELWCALTPAGKIAGVMRVVPNGFCGLYHYLSLIGTSPLPRGTGAGRFLMGEFESMAREGGSVRTCLLVSDFNVQAIDFYKALGYWELGIIPDAVKSGISEHVMLKELDSVEA